MIEQYTASPLIDKFRTYDINDLPQDEKEALEPRFNHTKLLYYDLKFRMLNLKNWLIFIDGETGIGKSTVAQDIFLELKYWLFNSAQGKQLIEYWKKKMNKTPDYSINKFSFSDTEFLDSVGKSNPLEINVKDENFETSAQIGGRAEKERKRMLISRIRGLQLCFIFIDPIFDDSKQSHLYNFRLFANDIWFEGKKNRSLIYVKDYDKVFKIFGHIKTNLSEVPGYQEKKQAQLLEIQRLQQPLYKRKRLKEIVKAMVYWVDPETKQRDDIRNYQKNCWQGLIKRRLDEMDKGGLRASTEIKEIKDSIDAYFPVEKRR